MASQGERDHESPHRSEGGATVEGSLGGRSLGEMRRMQLMRQRAQQGGVVSARGMPSIQRRVVTNESEPAPSGPEVQAAAERGLDGPSEPLPHRETIQRSFGAHDVSGVKTHRGPAASEGASAMGAAAFASGDQIAFDGAPDLRTAAHEAAHVVQQRNGVQPSGGVGEKGDAHEQNADAVAERVVNGESAEDLLPASSDAAPSSSVQRVLVSGGKRAYRTFTQVEAELRRLHVELSGEQKQKLREIFDEELKSEKPRSLDDAVRAAKGQRRRALVIEGDSSESSSSSDDAQGKRDESPERKPKMTRDERRLLESSSDEEEPDAKPATRGRGGTRGRGRGRGGGTVTTRGRGRGALRGGFQGRGRGGRLVGPGGRDRGIETEVAQSGDSSSSESSSSESSSSESSSSEPSSSEPSSQGSWASDDTDFEDQAGEDALQKRVDRAWSRDQPKKVISEATADRLVREHVRANIRKLVRDAYGGAAKDEPGDLDDLAQSLLPEGSRNCSACVDIDRKRYVGHNNRDLKAVRGYNSKRADDEPKLHSVAKMGRRDNEHAEQRLADLKAGQYAKGLGKKDEYDAEEAMEGIDELGIFQPCCMLCAACFAAAGVADVTRGYHTKKVTLWQWPPWILADTAAMAKILGPDAMGLIGDNRRNLEVVMKAVIDSATKSGWD